MGLNIIVKNVLKKEHETITILTKKKLLDFHHIDPTQKDFQLSQGERYGWEKVQSEIEKCIVLCSNCHRDFHYLEKKDGISIEEYVNLNKNKLKWQDTFQQNYLKIIQ